MPINYVLTMYGQCITCQINNSIEGEKMSFNSTTLSIRTDEELKEKVGKILNEIGLNHSTAINIYYRLILANRGIPFDLKIPDQANINELEESIVKDSDSNFDSRDSFI